MKIRPMQELWLYSRRYFLGYALLAALTVGLLFLSFTHLPAGLSPAEEASAVVSNSMAFDKTFIDNIRAVDLPFHILQKGSLELFGLSTLGVRLPSILLGIGAAFFLFLMLHRWLRANVAVVTGLLVVTSSWFLSVARLGTPDIMIIFWSALILLLATLISQETKLHHLWKALLVIVAGLALYTPFMAYLLLAALVAGMSQPHLRYLIRHTDNTSILIGGIFFAILLVPLGWHIYNDPGVIKELFLVSGQLPDPVQFLTQLLAGFSHLLNPFVYNADNLLTPLISIPITALAIIGLWRIFVDFHSVRSHVLLLWLALLLPAIGLSNQGNLAMLFVPIMLLTAIGVQSLFRYWYALFPRNPYARVFGLIPLAVLVLSMIQFNYQRYFMASPYIANVANQYTMDPLLLSNKLASAQYKDKQRLVVIVPEEKVALYSINKNIMPQLTVASPASFTPGPNINAGFVAEHALGALSKEQFESLPTGKQQLLVNDLSKDALRFRVYSQ